MKFVLSCPSKTFILGEYLVLNGGGALLLNTAPRFQLLVSSEGDGMVQGLEPQSPAGQWIRQNRLLFSKTELDFFDPHEGRGGFGASSAQYLMVHAATQILKNGVNDLDKFVQKQTTHTDDQVKNLNKNLNQKLENYIGKIKIETIWRAFQQGEMVSHEGLRPSGADIVSQFVGGLCQFQPEPFGAVAFKWPFDDYEVVLVHTGHKMATHEHLRGLKRVNTDELGIVYERALETLSVGDAPAFFDSVNDYYAELLEVGLVSETTQVIVASLMAQNFVRAAKGCGAMGNDVVAIFIAKENRKHLVQVLDKLNLSIVTGSNDIQPGFLISEDVSQFGVINKSSYALSGTDLQSANSQVDGSQPSKGPRL